jgi:hypothetical protein
MVAMKHRARLSQAERAAFAEAIAWASMGTSAHSTGLKFLPAPEAQGAEAAWVAGLRPVGAAGIEPATSRV